MMELKKVLNGLEGLKAKGNLDLEITGVESDSRQVKKRLSICSYCWF